VARPSAAGAATSLAKAPRRVNAGAWQRGRPVVKTAAMADRRARAAVVASLLGWTLDAFDFFLLVFVLAPVAAEFHRPLRDIALALTVTLALRPVGALLFGLAADRWGRRGPLMADILFYSAVEVATGLAPGYRSFLLLRALYGIGMGGEWGVGASLAMESVPAARRGLVSGLLQEGYAAGYLLAALAYAVVFPRWGWRPLFFVGGLPALLVLYIRARVPEPEAWQRTRLADWRQYTAAARRAAPRFAYLVALMAAMNLISHGTQDLYPTFLQLERGLGAHPTAAITVVSMLGAIAGGLVFGAFSDRRGRRRAMLLALAGAAAAVPLWTAARTALLPAGAFLMQFMVQGAWGVIPAHLNELAPAALRGVFPGFAYQLGVLLASAVEVIEAALAERIGYRGALAAVALVVLALGALVIAAGPEARGRSFLGTSASDAVESTSQPAARRSA
jgi:SHS family lactate transporter-like MFS transporter